MKQPSLPSCDEIRSAGRALREKTPRSSHAHWQPSARHADVIALLKASEQGRMARLIPLRYGRMLQSPFTFFRGTAAVMAADLATTPTSGIRVQSCGDCHVLNFGVFATPERRAIFDINDFDETLPAPFEWDVKRLAASFVIAGVNNRLDDDVCRDAAREVAKAYRESMADFARMNMLEVWYNRLDAETLIAGLKSAAVRRSAQARLARERRRDASELFSAYVEKRGARYTLRDQPPLLFHAPRTNQNQEWANITQSFAQYKQTLQADRRALLDRYHLMDIAIKVVGIGSVGTYCCVLLLMAGEGDPLFLQCKQANASVLEPYAGKSSYRHHGQRVVEGQRMVQTASDLFLGWTTGQQGRQFYLRQLRDVKIRPMVETWDADMLLEGATCWGSSLARAHARSGQAGLISGYLGSKDSFDKAIAGFAMAYCEQNQHDYAALAMAVRARKIAIQQER